MTLITVKEITMQLRSCKISMSKNIDNADQKIDFVLIWVDGNDKKWQAEKAKYDTSVTYGDSDVRFRDWENLQYWFRGVEKFAPWVNKIHFVTWGHLPKWLNTSNPKLNIVNHHDYIPEKYLPTFNSHTIELNLHRIKGLSEQFVYFNDDMFVTNYVQPTDFFKNGKPRDTFALDTIFFGKGSAGFFNGADLEIINTDFPDKHKIFRRDFKKWYNPHNGFKSLIRTTLLLPWPYFSGFYYPHISSNFLKSTFEEVWEKEYDVLDQTCNDKFRQKTNVNQWLFKYWQLASGNYEVISYKTGMCYHIKEKNFAEACNAVRNGKYKITCINDTDNTMNFEEKKQKVLDSFHQLLPEKSSFEI